MGYPQRLYFEMPSQLKGLPCFYYMHHGFEPVFPEFVLYQSQWESHPVDGNVYLLQQIRYPSDVVLMAVSYHQPFYLPSGFGQISGIWV